MASLPKWRTSVYHHTNATLAQGGARLVELMNVAAREVVAYFAVHRSNPKLPRTAWDAELGCFNEIPREFIDAKPAPELQPRLCTRETE
jgi:hypothetical protein